MRRQGVGCDDDAGCVLEFILGCVVRAEMAKETLRAIWSGVRRLEKGGCNRRLFSFAFLIIYALPDGRFFMIPSVYLLRIFNLQFCHSSRRRYGEAMQSMCVSPRPAGTLSGHQT